MRLGLSVWPDQALNLIRACTMLDVSFYAVDSVHAGEHIGRFGRSGCCHGGCRDKRLGCYGGDWDPRSTSWWRICQPESSLTTSWERGLACEIRAVLVGLPQAQSEVLNSGSSKPQGPQSTRGDDDSPVTTCPLLLPETTRAPAHAGAPGVPLPREATTLTACVQRLRTLHRTTRWRHRHDFCRRVDRPGADRSRAPGTDARARQRTAAPLLVL